MKLEDALTPGAFVRQSPFVLGLQGVIVLGVLGGIVAFGCWQLLWALAIIYPIVVVAHFIRQFYWREFDPFIWKAAGSEKKGKFVFWNVLTIFLDWITNAIPMSLGACVVCKLGEGSRLPALFVWLMLSVCIYPVRMQVDRNHTFLKDTFATTLFLLTLGFAIASQFFPVTPLLVSAVVFGLTPVMVSVSVWQEWKGMWRDYDEILGERRRGFERRPTWGRCWFPRKGVIFEPQYNQYSKINVKTFFEHQKSFTVLRVNWCGCAMSLALLVFGIVRCVQLEKSPLLLFVPVVVWVGLFHGAITSVIERKLHDSCAQIRIVVLLFAMLALTVPTVYFGGIELQKLLAFGSLFLGCWFFFFGFIVRGTSEGVFDTLELLVCIATLAAVVSCRVCLKCIWWEAMLPMFGFAVVYGHLRDWFPRRDLPEIPEGAKGNGGSGKAKVGFEVRDEKAAAEKKERRDRKRERQMAAFRRSKRG